MHFAPESERHQLADDDTETPGRQDRIQRPAIEPPYHDSLGSGPDQPAGQESQRGRQHRRQPEAGGHQRGIGPDRDEGGMGKIDDLHHAEDDQQTSGDDEEDRGGGDNVEHERDHAGEPDRAEAEEGNPLLPPPALNVKTSGSGTARPDRHWESS